MARPRELRPYQSRIANAAAESNCIVVLPTGAGKTLIAAEVCLRHVSSGGFALFFVPTIPLVSQQAKEVESWVGSRFRVECFHGGKQPPCVAAQIIVTTPAAFLQKQEEGLVAFQFARFSLVVLDEVHHCLKDHPYRKIAKRMRTPLAILDQKPMLRVLGLTASLTYQVKETSIQSDFKRLATELGIESMQTASQEELVAGGYRGGHYGQGGEVLQQSEPSADVDLSNVDAGGQQTARADDRPLVPESERKPHLLLVTFFTRVGQGAATILASAMVEVVEAMENHLRDADVGPGGSYAPVLRRKRSLADWGEYVHTRYLMASRAAGKGKAPQDIAQKLRAAESWLESLRIVIKSWEEDGDLAMMFLVMEGRVLGFDSLGMSAFASVPEVISVWGRHAGAFQRYVGKGCCFHSSRCAKLRDVLLLQQTRTGGGLRAIVFVRDKVTALVLTDFIENDKQLAAVGLRAVHMWSATTNSGKATPSHGITRAQQDAHLQQFRDGSRNVLVTTVVSEEGMDIPAANCTVRFDPLINSVSLVQGRGRARQEDAAHVVMCERADRPVSHLVEAELLQHRLIEGFVPPSTNERIKEAARDRDAQLSRERTAVPGISSWVASGSPVEDALSVLNMFRQKTKADVKKTCAKEGAGRWVGTTTYQSVLRTHSARGEGNERKIAERASARELLLKLVPELKCDVP